MKTMLTLINIVSLIPILLYPIIFIAGAMSFDAPGSGKSVLAWTIFIVSVGYPIYIISLIILSRIQNSILLSLLALLPLVFLVYNFFFLGNNAQKENYETLHKDFVCNENSFINIFTPENPISSVYLYEKKLFKYSEERIATIYNDQKSLRLNITNDNESNDKKKELILNCKNAEGKSMLDIFGSEREEFLGREFILRIGETVVIKDVKIKATKNVINSVKNSKSDQESNKNGITVQIMQGDGFQEYDFIDAEKSRLTIGEYVLEIKDRRPGQGSFVLYDN